MLWRRRQGRAAVKRMSIIHATAFAWESPSAILYLRRSSPSMPWAMTGQRSELLEACAEHGTGVARIYEETHVGRTLYRPALRRAMDHAQRDGLPVLTRDLTRLIRGRVDAEDDPHPDDVRVLQESPVPFVLLVDPEASPTEVRSHRIRRGHADARKRGTKIGRPKATVDPAAGEAWDARIAELRCQGMSLREIASTVGVSHTRVRQTLRRLGLPTIPGVYPAAGGRV